MTSYADVKARRKAPQVRIALQLDGPLQARIDQVRAEVGAARAVAAQQITDQASLATPSMAPEVARLEAELADLQAAAGDAVAVFVFEALGYQQLEDLKLDHPPTVEQREQGLVWNPETFSPALMAAASRVVTDVLEDGSTVDVGLVLTVDDAIDICQTWPPGQVEALYLAAWEVCHSRGVVRGFSRPATGTTPGGGTN